MLLIKTKLFESKNQMGQEQKTVKDPKDVPKGAC